MILITGSQGLVGRHLCIALEKAGQDVRRFDIARDQQEDVRDPHALASALRGVTGVVHLAAMSRVVLAQQAPLECEAVNVTALTGLLRLCLGQSTRPWVIFASSREVYGAQDNLPVAEDAALRPMNVYARSKVRGERLMTRAVEAGLVANVCRLSNVYGCPFDHPDRVATAFATAAARGGTMRVDGAQSTFDFTAIGDVVQALARLIEATAAGERMPVVQFVSGRGTSLINLARLAQSLGLAPVSMVEAAPRDFDVARFIGDPEVADRRLGWRARTTLQEGMAQLISQLALYQGAN